MTRVLIVDDEFDTLNVMKMFLELSGYEAYATLNSVDAIRLAERCKPDCVLLDVMMPQLDGFKLCKMMRLYPATKDLPIMFVTAYAPMDLEERRIDAGADLVLSKPFTMDGLVQAVERLRGLRPVRPAVSGFPASARSLVVQRNASPDVFASAFKQILGPEMAFR